MDGGSQICDGPTSRPAKFGRNGRPRGPLGGPAAKRAEAFKSCSKDLLKPSNRQKISKEKANNMLIVGLYTKYIKLYTKYIIYPQNGWGKPNM